MEQGRKSKRFRSLPKRLLDSVVESPLSLTLTSESNSSYVEEPEPNSGEIDVKANSDEECNTAVMDVDDKNEPPIDDHYYCKKDEKSNVSPIHPVSLSEPTAEKMELLKTKVNTSKRKRGRPQKRKVNYSSVVFFIYFLFCEV